MGFRVKVLPGVRVRVSRRGVRTSLGPRVARVHVGGGRTAVSTGFGPVGAYGAIGRKKRRRRAASSPHSGTDGGTFAGLFNEHFERTSSGNRAEDLESWLNASPPPLDLPGRFTQNWFRENMSSVHPGQVPTLLDELASRGWSRDDIDRRVMPHLERVNEQRRVSLVRLAREREEAARIEQAAEARQFGDARIASERREAKARRVDERKAARSTRWRLILAFPSATWRRIGALGHSQPQSASNDPASFTQSAQQSEESELRGDSDQSRTHADPTANSVSKHQTRAEMRHEAIEQRRNARAARWDAQRRS